MKFRRLIPFILTLALSAGTFSGYEILAEELSEEMAEKEQGLEEKNDIQMFRPVDCGIQAQEIYEYPFLGLTFSLSEEFRNKIDDREVFVYTQEDYAEENVISYGVLRFSAVTEAQRTEETMSVDIISWEEALEKIGAIVVCRKDISEQSDDTSEQSGDLSEKSDDISEQLKEWSGCDIYEKLGESADGAYEYYLCTNSNGSQELIDLLKEADISITDMHKLDMELGYSAFSEDRMENVNTVGNFTMEDVFGETYTQEMFAEYDLTLVNVFATWCSPCVQEMPELEELRKAYEEKDVKLGIAAVVLDTKTMNGLDEGAVERAQTLYERSGVQFPFLIPDETEMNGRLTGISSVPESFFVNSKGEIVSEPYIGARAMEDWAEIVEKEMENLKGNNQ